MHKTDRASEPLPVWIFVGLLLIVYGILLIASTYIYPVGTTVLAQMKPTFWWGALMTAFGAAILALGLRSPSDT